MAEKEEAPQEDFKATVSKPTVRAEIGRSPGMSVDEYPRQLHIDSAYRIYGVASHVVTGALSFAGLADRERLTVDEVKSAINNFVKQVQKER